MVRLGSENTMIRREPFLGSLSQADTSPFVGFLFFAGAMAVGTITGIFLVRAISRGDLFG